MSFVTVSGVINNLDGTPYKGAIVEAYLNSQMNYDGAIYGNEIFRTITDSYGQFELELVPSTIDSKGNNFYTFKIVKETTNTYRKIVPATEIEVSFDTLVDFVPQGQRVNLLGNLNQTINPNPVVLPQSLIGLFTWQTFEVDGSIHAFTVPGTIYLVAVNGVVVSPDVDYINTAENSIDFYVTPLNGDLVAIQYRI